MTDIKQYEPLWGAWTVDSLIGEGSFGRVYKVRREEFGKTHFSAVKLISIPQSEADVRQLHSEGMDNASLRSYFHAFVTDIIEEINLMSEYRGNSNIVSFEDHKVIEKTGEIGWDILIRMELLTSLTDHVTTAPLTRDEVIKLGIHICCALELCAQNKTIHRDIKPDNIFISQYGDYKLGDFGIARRIEKTASGLSKKGTYTYMAPEVFRGGEYGANVDTYSLGIVLYRLLNKNRTPFLPEFPALITPRDRDESLYRRMNGEPIPPIAGTGPALNAIIQKACAFDRRARFSSPAVMREALEAAASDKDSIPDAALVHDIIDSDRTEIVGSIAEPQTEELVEQRASKKKKRWIIAAGIAAACIIAPAAILSLLPGSLTPSPSPPPSPSPSPAPVQAIQTIQTPSPSPISVPDPSPVPEENEIRAGTHTIAAGKSHSLAITEDGSLWAWGSNEWGQLGSGRRADSSVPIQIMDNAIAVAAGDDHSLVITADGNLLVWGQWGKTRWSTQGGYGVFERLLDNVTAIAAGDSHCLAITEDGSLWAWGGNDFGQLGTGEANIYSINSVNGTLDLVDDKNEYDPVKIMDNVIAVAAGSSHSMAVTADGSLWAWGLNAHGRVGNGTMSVYENDYASPWYAPLEDNNVKSPVKVMDNVTAIAAGDSHSLAITEDGSLWAWGDNGLGQFGNSTKTGSDIPIKIMDDVVYIAAAAAHNLAKTADGRHWAWGYDYWTGQLDSGIGIGSSFPVEVHGVVAIAAGLDYGKHNLAATEDGSLWAWGDNNSGKIGNGTMNVSVYDENGYWKLVEDYNAYTPVKIMDNILLPDMP